MNMDKSELLYNIKFDLQKKEGYKLLNKLFDKDSMEELNPFCKYNDIESGIVCGFGRVNGKPVYAFVHSVDVNGAAMSTSQALKLSKFYSLAAKSGYPIVGIFNSRGASLNQGNELLEAYGNTIRECSKLEGIVPQIAVINGMCFGAMSLIAGCFDIVIMTKSSRLGIDIGGENSSCDEALKEGIADIVAENEDKAIQYVKKFVSFLPENNLSECSLVNFEENSSQVDLNENMYGYINDIADKDTFIELKKDYGKHFITGFASFKGRFTGIIASNSRILKEADYDSCAKAASFIMLCDSYNIPIVTFVDTSKINSTKGATKLVSAYSNATVPKVSIVVGKAYGSSYTVLCNKRIHDIVLCWVNAEISILNPNTAVEILWKDKLHGDGINFKENRNNLVEKYINEEASSIKACQSGIVDDIFDPNETKNKLCFALDMLSNKRQVNLPKKHGNIKI